MVAATMSDHMIHAEVSGPVYKRTDTRVDIEPFLQYDIRRSKSYNRRAFRRYLTLLRGLNQETHICNFVSYEWSGPTCMVCAQTGSDMPNRFHMKGGTLSKLDDTPWHGRDEKRQGFFVELECDNTPQNMRAVPSPLLYKRLQRRGPD